jgi:hypothetical protein
VVNLDGASVLELAIVPDLSKAGRSCDFGLLAFALITGRWPIRGTVQQSEMTSIITASTGGAPLITPGGVRPLPRHVLYRRLVPWRLQNSGTLLIRL